jgi:hypothetical protein
MVTIVNVCVFSSMIKDVFAHVPVIVFNFLPGSRCLKVYGGGKWTLETFFIDVKCAKKKQRKENAS